MANTTIEVPELATGADLQVLGAPSSAMLTGSTIMITGTLSAVQASISTVRYTRSPHFDGSDSLFLVAGEASFAADFNVSLYGAVDALSGPSGLQQGQLSASEAAAQL